LPETRSQSGFCLFESIFESIMFVFDSSLYPA